MAFATAVVVTTEFVAVGLLPAMARDLHLAIGDAAVVVTGFALAAAILGPFLTIAASHIQPRNVLAIALAIFALGNLAIAWMPTLATVVAIRAVQGAVLPVFGSVGNAAVAELAGAGREGTVIARINIGLVAVSLLGVPGGVALADRFGWQAAFGALGALSVLALVALNRVFPRIAVAQRSPVLAQARILLQPMFQGHLLLSGMLFVAMFTGYTYLAVFLEQAAHFDGRGIALALLGFGAAGVLGNTLAGRIVDRAPIGTTAAVAFAIVIATATLGPARSNLLVLLTVLGFWGAAHAAAFVVCQTRVLRAGSQAPAFALSLNMSVCNLGIAAGSLAGAWIIRCAGVSVVGAGAALFGLCAGLWALLLRQACR
jgi:predicted MFS family arabinose efflux permease